MSYSRVALDDFEEKEDVNKQRDKQRDKDEDDEIQQIKEDINKQIQQVKEYVYLKYEGNKKWGEVKSYTLLKCNGHVCGSCPTQSDAKFNVEEHYLCKDCALKYPSFVSAFTSHITLIPHK
jgi:hypothetical protein